MTDPLPAPSDMLESLFASAQEKQQQEDEAHRATEERQQRLREHGARRERLANAFRLAYRFPNEERQQERKPSSDGFRRWAERFVELGKILRECDEAIEELCLQARLRAVAARTAPAAMKFACALLLLAAEANSETVASALERANDDWELRRFVLWLPFILDHLWYPFPRADGLIEMAQSPSETSLEENHEAEQALRGSLRNVQSPPGLLARVDQALDDAPRHQRLLVEDPDTIEEPPGIGGQADSKADKKPKKSHRVPVNPDILKLAKKIKKDREKGMSLIDSAREFCEGNERRAQSLLRQLRRYPGLWK